MIEDPHPREEKTMLKRYAYLILGLVVVGCGGGGASTGSTGSNTSNSQGQAAVTYGAQGFQAFNVSSGYQQSSRSSGARTGSRFAALLKGLRDRSGRNASSYSYDSDWGLYTELIENSQTSWTEYFSTNGYSNDAGTITIAYNQVSQYPVTATLGLNVTAGSAPVAGSMTVVIDDSSFQDYQVNANYQSGGVQLQYNLSYSPSSITGSLATSSNGNYVSFTSLSETSSSLSANYNYDGVTGSVRYNADGSGDVTANTSSGTWTLAWNSSGYATITNPQGQVVSQGQLSSM
jgi:hypothetical protein